MANICSGFCNMAHEASLDSNFPYWMRWSFCQFGEFWYWMGHVFEGDALELWRELQAEKNWQSVA